MSVANKFVGDGVKFVIGHFNSGVTIPASEVYQENGILEITPAATNPKVTERNMWNIFRTCGRDDQQGAVAGDYILKNFKGKKIAVVHDKTTYGQGLADETRKRDQQGRHEGSALRGRQQGRQGLLRAGLQGQGLRRRPRLLGRPARHRGGLILRQMRDQGVKAPLMGGDGITDDEFAAIAGPGRRRHADDLRPDPRKRPKPSDAVEKFRAKKFEPQAYTLYSYAAVQIIKQAAEAASRSTPRRSPSRSSPARSSRP